MGFFEMEIFKEKQQRPGTPVGLFLTLVFPIIVIIYIIYLVWDEDNRADIQGVSVVDLATTQELVYVSFKCLVAECLLLTYSPDGKYCIDPATSFPQPPVKFPGGSTVEYGVCYAEFVESPRIGVLLVGDYSQTTITQSTDGPVAQALDKDGNVLQEYHNTITYDDIEAIESTQEINEMKLRKIHEKQVHAMAAQKRDKYLNIQAKRAFMEPEEERLDREFEMQSMMSSTFSAATSGFADGFSGGFSDYPGGFGPSPAFSAYDHPISAFWANFLLSCSPYEFQCQDSLEADEPVCIHDYKTCDGTNDCEDGSDEACLYGIPIQACSSSEFECVSDGWCIYDYWQCDEYQDCADGSDEDEDICADFEAGSYFEGTDSGACFLATLSDCPTDTCDTCGSVGNTPDYGAECFPASWICDGYEDCLDGRDEKNCADAITTAALTCQPPCGDHGLCVEEPSECVCDEGWVNGIPIGGETLQKCGLSTVVGTVGGSIIVRLPTEEDEDFFPKQVRLSMSRTIDNSMNYGDKEGDDPVVTLKVFRDTGGTSLLPTSLILKNACTKSGRDICGGFPTTAGTLASVLYVADPLFFVFTIDNGRLGTLGILGAVGGVLGAMYGLLAATAGVLNKFYYKINPKAALSPIEKKVLEMHEVHEANKQDNNKDNGEDVVKLHEFETPNTEKTI